MLLGHILSTFLCNHILTTPNSFSSSSVSSFSMSRFSRCIVTVCAAQLAHWLTDWLIITWFLDCFMWILWDSSYNCSLGLQLAEPWITLSLLKTYFYSQGLLRTGSATEWFRPWAALYKFRKTLRSALTLWPWDKLLPARRNPKSKVILSSFRCYASNKCVLLQRH